LAAALGVKVATLRTAGDVAHVLSHRRLQVRVLVGPLRARRRWTPPGPDYDAIEPVLLAELGSVAHSTLARKILRVANVSAGGRE
jgi:hypothetical protein